MARHRIVATGEGKLVFIYHKDLKSLLRLGAASIQRASEVEPTDPTGLQWTADLSRVAGPQLGPFEDRDEALTAEMQWLSDHLNEVAANISL